MINVLPHSDASSLNIGMPTIRESIDLVARAYVVETLNFSGNNPRWWFNPVTGAEVMVPDKGHHAEVVGQIDTEIDLTDQGEEENGPLNNPTNALVQRGWVRCTYTPFDRDGQAEEWYFQAATKDAARKTVAHYSKDRSLSAVTIDIGDGVADKTIDAFCLVGDKQIDSYVRTGRVSRDARVDPSWMF